MRETTLKKVLGTLAYYSQLVKMKRLSEEEKEITWLIYKIVFCASLIAGLTWINAQAQTVPETLDYREIGLDYMINGQWATQFRGRVTEINQSSIMISWYRFDETDILKNDTMAAPGANNYVLDLDFSLINENGTLRTHGSFRVAWLKGKDIIDIDLVDGYLRVRDTDHNLVNNPALITAWRKYDYDRGHFQ